MTSGEGPDGVRYHPVVGMGSRSCGARVGGRGPLALYVHIPFCDKRCHFCDFAVVAGSAVTEPVVDAYLRALTREMDVFLAAAEDLPVIEVIQFGGGTPTSLSARAIEVLLGFVLDRFDCSNLAEVVVEGFPDSITDDRVAVLERVPNLKLNIGVQSYSADCLAAVGREHGVNAGAAVARAVASGIASVGVDIIAGLPFSTEATVRTDVETSCALGVDHFALYPLWVYERTMLESKLRRGKVILPGRGSVRRQMTEGVDTLASNGYRRYTAFHHARSEATRHRYGLWQMLGRNWIGFGMSAMSHLDGDILVNDRNIRSYIDKVDRGDSPIVNRSRLSPAEQMRFVFLYGLRLEQYATALFAERFGVTVEEVFSERLQRLEDAGLLARTSGHVALTLPGILALRTIEDYINDPSDAAVLADPMMLAQT